MKKLPFTDKLLGIKGLTEITLGGILGEAGDLSKFAHGNSLLRHAGLHLAEASSGKWKGQIVISKRGRSRLRRFLFLTTLSLVMNNPEFKELHAYNVKVKKMKKMKSIMKLIGKLARILVGIARSNESYCPEKVQPLTSNSSITELYFIHFKEHIKLKTSIYYYHFIECWLIRRISKKARSTGILKQKGTDPFR